MELKGKTVLVFGAGKSGIGAAGLLADAGALPVLYDGNEKLTEEAVRNSLSSSAADCTQIVLKELPDEQILRADLCVLSPGVPTDLPDVNRIRDAGVPIWGEVELAYQCSRGEVLAITGTNGKTTTTALLGEIMKRHAGREKVFVVGNIGNPYTDAALRTDRDSICVAEISSFQLETIHAFHPHVSAITNITPDHLNRHHTMEEYIRVKEMITLNQTPDDYLVLNYEDSELRSFGQRIAGKVRVLWFSSARVLEEGMYVEDGVIRMSGPFGNGDLIPVDQLHLLGAHNYENVCTAALCALAAGVSTDEIREVLKAFRAVEHRIEFVEEIDGVAWYNDSKGTNPDAAIKAVQAMIRPTVLIGGGYDKDSSYDEWIESFGGKVKALVLVGATKEKIAECAAKHGFEPVYLCESFREAFDRCRELALSGDAVLLSPACASWGMFRNYEERGEIFKEMVRELKRVEK